MRKKKWLAVLLAVTKIVAMLPTSAFALTADGAVETEDELVAAMSAGGTVTLGSNITIMQAKSALQDWSIGSPDSKRLCFDKRGRNSK